MKIFLSHHSQQKPLIREIRKSLPKHISSWIDEEQLLIGDDISQSLESEIKTESDYVILFIDDRAVQSKWVMKEINWAFEREHEIGRSFLLPVVIEKSALEKISKHLQSRKYLSLKDFTEKSLRDLSESITSELFALICRDLQRSQNPSTKNATKTLFDADTVLNSIASMIRKAVFPHRKNNPIGTNLLLTVVNSQMDEPLNKTDFEYLLDSVVQRNLIPGLKYDGYELFLEEEHANWKSELFHAKKVEVGRKAASFIENGIKIFLDAGSTTEEITKIICRKIETRSLTKITIATNSINHSEMLSRCCVKMGFDDDFSAIQLHTIGGLVRPSTQATVSVFDNSLDITKLSEYLGGFDIGFLGVNGIDLKKGFTTHEIPEALNKKEILKSSKEKIIVSDSSKLGLALEEKFADFDDDIKLIINKEEGDDMLNSLINLHDNKIIIT